MTNAHADAVRHDCGEHGSLTVREIAATAGMTERAIRKRMAKGVTGAALCAPWKPGKKPTGIWRGQHGVPNTVASVVFMAILVARRYVGRTPSPAELRDEFGLSPAQAFRWARAFKAAQELDPPCAKVPPRRLVARRLRIAA
ncbi:MAG: hypothetical protein ACTHOL_19190 [Luteibacter jiangsuensis]